MDELNVIGSLQEICRKVQAMFEASLRVFGRETKLTNGRTLQKRMNSRWNS
jgi:hypothetical protein